ncbi:hypothetical protein GmHk_04G010727 [Glycine max]|nr:hypothetical protein GmHk_04G010727 [Glycine max]
MTWLVVSRFIEKIFNALNAIEHLFLAFSKCVDSFTNIDGYMSSSNHVLLNNFDKIVVFGDSEVSMDGNFISANQVMTSLKDDAQVYMILSNLEVETKVSMGDLPIVREFPKVFPKDISGLLPEREIEFSIDLVPGARPISIAPYRMSPIELAE